MKVAKKASIYYEKSLTAIISGDQNMLIFSTSMKMLMYVSATLGLSFFQC